MTRLRAWCPTPSLRLAISACPAILAAAAVAGVIALLHSGSYAARAVDATGDTAAALAATVGFIAAARASRYARRSWTWFAIGLGLLATSEAVCGAYEILLHRDVPTPSVADAGFLTGSLVVVVAGLLLPIVRSRAVVVTPVRRALDALIAAGSMLLISWALFWHQAFDHGGHSHGLLVVALAYPLCDVLALAAVVLTLPLTPRQHRAPLVLVGAGLLAMTLADTLFSDLTLRGSYVFGTPLDTAYMAAYLLLAIGGWRAFRGRARGSAAVQSTEEKANAASGAPVDQPAQREQLLPYIPLLLAFLVLLWQVVAGSQIHQAEVINALAVVVLVLIRQYLLFNDNVRLLGDLAQAQEELRFQAWHDGLTGLPNRQSLHRGLQAALLRRETAGSHVIVLMLDLDGFKEINDTYGHQVGDELLLDLAGRLRGVLRDPDTVARMGGDEFAVVIECDELEPEVVSSLLERTARRLVAAGGQGTTVQGNRLHVGISVGGTSTALPRTTAPTGAELLREADLALYTAKGRGRGQAVVFDPSLGSGERELTAKLRDVLLDPNGEGIFAVFQPIVNLDSGRLLAVEALARWRLPDGITVGPEIFVPLAEQAGLSAALFTRVMHAACAALRSWPVFDDDRADTFTMSVNVSARQLDDGLLSGMVRDLLEAYDLPAEHLVLEVTESALAEDLDRATDALDAVVAIGAKVAVDDFGTGWSSLSQLDRFPAQILKIDRSFVSRLGGDGRADRLVAGVLRLSEGLGLQTIAEGIEDISQLSRLRDLGCHAGQGYYFSRPVSADRIAAMLGDGAACTVAQSSAA
jgi:diguanylate cyclase (GGDEF)-like protein